MRRILLFTLACLLGMVAVKADDPANIKDGLQPEVTVYVIDSPEGLVKLADIVNEDGNTLADYTFTMTKDINLEDIPDWTPIGVNTSKLFKGIFDGNGKRFTNTSTFSRTFKQYTGMTFREWTRQS